MLEETGKNYWFLSREEMDEEIRENQFLEFGDYNGNLYGTHLDSIRDVIKQGKFPHLSSLFPNFSLLSRYVWI